jgi:hypothetical protein
MEEHLPTLVELLPTLEELLPTLEELLRTLEELLPTLVDAPTIGARISTNVGRGLHHRYKNIYQRW